MKWEGGTDFRSYFRLKEDVYIRVRRMNMSVGGLSTFITAGPVERTGQIRVKLLSKHVYSFSSPEEYCEAVKAIAGTTNR